MNAKPIAPTRITIVGGGFTAASSAVQLVRTSTLPVAITIIEPRPTVGGGLAHSADDPDHRLNGPAYLHYVDPSDSDSFQRWCVARDLVRADPGAHVADGVLYPRRQDFGRFVAQTVAEHGQLPGGSTIAHVRDVAQDLSQAGPLFTVHTRNGQAIASDMVMVATGNALPRLPAEFASVDPSHPGLLASPTDLARVRAIPKSARVLVLGTGLTALDILSTLVRSGHEGQITAVSRRGLRPASQRPLTRPAPNADTFHWPTRIDGPMVPFLVAAGSAPTLRQLTRALRERIRQVEAAGDLWYTPFDEIRDCLWQVWPGVSAQEKRRYLKRLRPWFDNFRFRSPPQNEAMVGRAEAAGRVRFQASRVLGVETTADGAFRVALRPRGTEQMQTQEFDSVINCTGLDAAAGVRDNPFLSALMRQGVIRVDETGVGLAAMPDCSAIAADGRVLDTLKIIGPPTNGTFADQVGAAFIAGHIRRALPSWLATVAALQAHAAPAGDTAVMRIKESA